MTWPRTGALVDTVRLASGLTLFTFAALHFINHALGLVSLDAMAAFQQDRLAVTRSLPGTIILAAALVAHLSLAFWRLARLRTLRLPASTLWQMISGVVVAALLTPHLIQAGILPRAFGAVMSYPAELNQLWPASAPRQTILLLFVWLHGCIGLHQWLKGEAWWRRSSHALAALAALLPAAALAGFAVAGREAARFDPPPPLPYPSASLPGIKASAASAQEIVLAVIALALAIALLRAGLALRRRRVAVCYDPGPKVFSAAGPTLLEISRANRVPHVSVCGGKARCSTCRVRVREGLEELPEPGEAELRLLRRIGAEPDVRLACQIRPERPITVTRLLRPETAGPAFASGLDAAGVVRVAAVLFVDIRGFTRLSETKLAFDVVYILNTFFAEAGRAVEASGGRVDKYMGDGLMAVFENADGLEVASRNALAAVAAIDTALQSVNRRLRGEIDAPLAVAMGLHGGRVVSGRVGFGAAALPTVIGRVVNIASRLESLAKTRDAELALSRDCAEAAGLSGLAFEEADLRGLDAAFPVALAPCVADLKVPPETVASR